MMQFPLTLLFYPHPTLMELVTLKQRTWTEKQISRFVMHYNAAGKYDELQIAKLRHS
jgi:hypothetical protein